MNFKCPSVLHFVFAVSFIPSLNYLSGYIPCFTQFGGSSNSLNFDKICGTAPFTLEIPGKLLHENMIPSHVKTTCYLHVEKITIAMAP